MGSDRSQNSIRAKRLEDLGRRPPKRSSYERVLIVCEGTKTEPNYFISLVQTHRLNSANVEVTGDCGSDPLSIVSEAERLYAEQMSAGNPFDRVFCVFDRDNHTNFGQALHKVRCMIEPNVFYAIYSIPSFEYWILLHFEDTSKVFTSQRGRSAGKQVISEIKSNGYIKNYAKNDAQLYAFLADRREVAIARSKKRLRNSITEKSNNPITVMHILVEYLINMNTATDEVIDKLLEFEEAI